MSGFDFVTTDSDSGVTYTPWTDGWAIGFRATHPDGRVEYIILNPSGGSDEAEDATVFVYMGTTDKPGEDDCQPVHWYQVFEAEGPEVAS